MQCTGLSICGDTRQSLHMHGFARTDLGPGCCSCDNRAQASQPAPIELALILLLKTRPQLEKVADA